MFQGLVCRGIMRHSGLHRHFLTMPIKYEAFGFEGICAISSSSLSSFEANRSHSELKNCTRRKTWRSILMPGNWGHQENVFRVDGASTRGQLLQSVFKRGFCAKAAQFAEFAQPMVKEEDLVGWNPETRDLYRQYATELLPKGWEEMMCSAGREGNQELFSFSHPEFGATFEYAVFANREEKRIITIMQFGHKTQGAPGFVHGGAIATAADECGGFVVNGLLLRRLCMTGNLNVSYQKAIPLGTTVVIETHLEKTEGRKQFTVSTFKSPDGSVVYTIVNTIFIELAGTP